MSQPAQASARERDGAELEIFEIEVQLRDMNISVDAEWPADLQALLASSLARLGRSEPAEVCLVLAGDELLAGLNSDYRQKAGPTDVLSFPTDSEGWPADLPCPLGDIIISVDYARRTAEAKGHTLLSELRLLSVHGLLHLLGHEDETDEGASEMRELELELGVRGAGRA